MLVLVQAAPLASESALLAPAPLPEVSLESPPLPAPPNPPVPSNVVPEVTPEVTTSEEKPYDPRLQICLVIHVCNTYLVKSESSMDWHVF